MRLVLVGTVLISSWLVAGASSGSGQQAPAAPTELSESLGVLRWVDNADDEEGFSIVIRTFNGAESVHTYSVGPNVTEFTIPADVPRGCPDYPSVTFEVRSFIGQVESEPARTGVIGECLPPTAVADASPTAVVDASPTAATSPVASPMATNTPEASALPETGNAGGSGTPGWPSSTAAVVLAVVATGSLALYRWQRSTK